MFLLTAVIMVIYRGRLSEEQALCSPLEAISFSFNMWLESDAWSKFILCIHDASSFYTDYFIHLKTCLVEIFLAAWMAPLNSNILQCHTVVNSSAFRLICTLGHLDQIFSIRNANPCTEGCVVLRTRPFLKI